MDKPIISPLTKLLYSRKVMLLLLTAITGTVIYVVTEYAGPEALKAAKFLIVTWTPIVIVIIGAIAYEDGQEKRGGESHADPAGADWQAGFAAGSANAQWGAGDAKAIPADDLAKRG